MKILGLDRYNAASKYFLNEIGFKTVVEQCNFQLMVCNLCTLWLMLQSLALAILLLQNKSRKSTITLIGLIWWMAATWWVRECSILSRIPSDSTLKSDRLLFYPFLKTAPKNRKENTE